MSDKTPTIDEVYELALKLTPDERQTLVRRVVDTLSEDDTSAQEHTEPTWTDEEIAEMIRPQPMTGAEVIAAGLTGTWADLGITDSVEWVEDVRRKRKEKRDQW